MLVCVYYCAFGTRDRGCQSAPGFPCALCLEGEDKELAKLGRNRAARSRTHTLSPRRPCERRDPYAAAEIVRKYWSTTLLQLRTVAMGPCFRRDDGESRDDELRNAELET